MPQVTFIPDAISVEVPVGEKLLRAAMIADVPVSASCGGDGTCGKCRMIVEQGAVEGGRSSKLSRSQIEQNYVLGCLAQVTGDVTVRIPPESRPGRAPAAGRGSRLRNTVLSAEACSARVPAKRSAPPLYKRAVELSPPDLTDNASDLTRLSGALRREHRLADATFSIDAVRALPAAARDGDWTVTAHIFEPNGCTPQIMGIDAGDSTDTHYAVAVDIGTTTVEVALLELVSGETIATAAEYNRQITRGEDVITRVIAASKEDGLETLQRLVTDTVGDLVEQACEEADVPVESITHYSVAGNTVMTHLLLGITPRNIRTTPYAPAASTFPWVRAAALGLPGAPGTQVVCTPCPASWLGGDIVAGVLAAGIPWTEKLTLFVDIGTNGEIVLGNRDWLVACSCSAGPAFEGGGILHGMRASAGAIEQVRVQEGSLEPSILTIENARPLGICGSGLIDLVSELFLCGAVDRNGTFTTDAPEAFVRDGDHGREYLLVPGVDSGTGEDIVLTENDVENLMRAKAAIFAGISVLVESVDLSMDAIEEVVIAGGFGHYLDLERVTALGMVPELPADRFVFIGNSSLLGAKQFARSREMLNKARKVAEMITYVELSVNAAFMEAYVSATFFPHTETSLFPVAEQLLAERSARKAVT